MPSPCNIPIIVLAAGQSSRMRGRDKLLEIVEGVPLIRRQANIALAATNAPVFVTLPNDQPARVTALSGCNVTRIDVPDAVQGMSASLRRGLQALPADTEAVMILLADLPKLTTDDLRLVCAATDFNSDNLIWRAATKTGAPGHPIVFARALFEALMDMSGDTGGAEVIAHHREKMVLVPLADDRARLDLDTPEEWDAWHRANAQSK